MTTRFLTVLFAACLLAHACGGVPKALEDKQPTADEERKAFERAMPRLRDLLYCDKSLYEALDIFAVNDEAVGRAVTEVRAKEYDRALATLRGLKGRGESPEGLSYWLALAAAHRGAGNAEEARDAARHLVSSEETRVSLQAWTVLRELGESPPAKHADDVLGVVVETGLEDGVAVVAGYDDGVARVFFSRGGGVIGDFEPEPVQRAAKELTRTAAPLARSLAAGARQGLPARGRVRITLLTPSGARVAEEDIDRVEEAGHRLYAVYVAARGLFAEVNKTYEAK
ncbi:MAG TPA: hypothetical protein VGP08_13960 [Pyrinomonadaceae bacterium]|jgi:hypothetical protein|nr:hypothetical protein [Pyrinomonadaceae bacterium]